MEHIRHLAAIRLQSKLGLLHMCLTKQKPGFVKEYNANTSKHAIDTTS